MCLVSSLKYDIDVHSTNRHFNSHLCSTVHELRIGRMFEFGKICMRIAIVNDNATVPVDLQVYKRKRCLCEKNDVSYYMQL